MNVVRPLSIYMLATSILHSVAGVAEESIQPDIEALRKVAELAGEHQAVMQARLKSARQNAWTLGKQVRLTEQAFGDAQQRLDEAEKAINKKKSAGQQPTTAELDQLKAIRTARDSAARQAEQTQRDYTSATEQLAQTDKQFEEADLVYTVKLTAYQSARADIGRFVYFSREVAPILARRCLSCHSPRVSKGRIDLGSYAGIMRGGVNGEIVEREDAESSTLYLSVKDGTMPREDDRLTEEEVAIIRKWIDLGAELDAGLHPDDGLASLIPRLAQPQPPETYRVPVPVTAVAFGPAGRLLATAGYHEVILWTAEDGRLVRRLTDVAQQTYGIDFNPEGDTVVVASGTPAEIGETSLFRVSDGRRLRTLITSTGVMYSARYSRDGQWIATAGEDKLIHVFNARDGNRRFKLADHYLTVMDVAWAPNDKWLASVSLDKNVKVFDTKTGLQFANFQKATESSFEGLVYGVDFSPDGSKVVSCGNHRHVRISNTDDGKLVREIGGFDASVMRVRVSQAGTVYSSSANHTITAHNLEDGQLIQTFEGHRDWVYALALHEATGRLASGSHDGEVRIWNLKTGELELSFVGSPGRAHH